MTFTYVSLKEIDRKWRIGQSKKKYEEKTNGLAIGKIGGWKEKGAEEERGRERKKGQT